VGRIIRRPRADDDLLEIWVHIARLDLAAANGILTRIDDRLRRLSEFPNSGRSRAELSPHLRSVAVGNYLLFHIAREDGIELVRVFHAARDLDSLFDEDR